MPLQEKDLKGSKTFEVSWMGQVATCPYIIQGILIPFFMVGEEFFQSYIGQGVVH